MYLNPHLFFILKQGHWIVWDCLNHQQFELEPSYAQRLHAFSKGDVIDALPMDQELEEGGLISQTPFEEKPWKWGDVSRLFHQETRNIADHLMTLSVEEWTRAYLQECESVSQEAPPAPDNQQAQTENFIALPPPLLTSLNQKSFSEILHTRKTSRSFYGQPLSLETLSTFLYWGLGPIHSKWDDLEDNHLKVLGRRKSFPSAGGLHAEEGYVVALHVEGLAPGVYHYDSVNHGLREISLGDFEESLIPLLYGQYFAKGLSAGLFLTSKFEKMWWKYPHSRAYRMALLDIGHASQSLALTATALGLETWMTGAFADQSVEEFLKISDSSESALFFLGVGYGSKASLPETMLALLPP